MGLGVFRATSRAIGEPKQFLYPLLDGAGLACLTHVWRHAGYYPIGQLVTAVDLKGGQNLPAGGGNTFEQSVPIEQSSYQQMMGSLSPSSPLPRVGRGEEGGVYD